VTATEKTAALLRGGKTAVWICFRRKAEQPFDGWNVVVGSCPAGQLVGVQGEKAEGQPSAGCKVPSSRAFLGKRGNARLRSVGAASRPGSRGGGHREANPVVVLRNSDRALQNYLGIAETHGATCGR